MAMMAPSFPSALPPVFSAIAFQVCVIRVRSNKVIVAIAVYARSCCRGVTQRLSPEMLGIAD
jgi:hypothetical protein